MNRVPLLNVEETSWLERPGLQMLIIYPVFRIPEGWDERGWFERTETVLITTPDECEFEAAARINMTHLSIRDPDVPAEDRWRITMWLTDRRPEEVPIGSTISVSPDIRDAILPCSTA